MNNKNLIALVHKMADELYHHGINGMHWGVRNGPPYPLDKKLSKRIQAGHNEKARYTAKEYRDMRSGKIKTTEKDKAGITHRVAKYEHLWTEGVSASDVSRIANVASLLLTGDIPIQNVRRLDRPGGRIQMSDAIDVNGERVHRPEDPGLSNNCGLCSAALAMRARGYDVQAGRAGKGTLISATQYYFDGARPYKERSPEAIQRRLESFGRRGQGVISIRRATGSGHAVYFQTERDQETGQYRPVIYDGQVGRRYSSLLEFLEAEGADTTQFTTITRTDDATPNLGHMAEDSVIRMRYKNAGMNVTFNPRTQEWMPATNVIFDD